MPAASVTPEAGHAQTYDRGFQGTPSVVAGVEFGYEIGDVTGGLKPLVSTVEGRWAFAPAGTGVRVTWAWTLHPLNAGSSLAMPLFGRLWHGYARQALEQIEGLLLPG